MKILFTADWHIKLTSKNIPKDWQINRFELLFKKIVELQKQVDLTIVGGDIFDKLPSMEELKLYFSFISSITHPTIIYDGNHEATKKGKTFLTHLKDITAKANSNVAVITSYTPFSFNNETIDILPYADLKKVKSIKPTSKILCTHVRGEIKPHVKPEIDLTLLDKWKIVLAGDLHSHENTQRNIVYPGSPLATSFHRNLITNGVIIFDTNTLEYRFIDLQLPQLIRKTIENPDDAKPTNYHYTIYELVGNVKDLANTDTNDLIEKKIIQRETKATLDLKNKSGTEELKEYLEKIQKLDEESVEELVSIHLDTIPDELLE